MEKYDLPVKRNQEFIVTHFSKTREKFCNHLLGDDKHEGSKSLSPGEECPSLAETRKELLIKVGEY